MKRTTIAALVIAALLGVACDNSARPGGGGAVDAILVSPNGDEGAAVLDVVGQVESFTGSDDVSVYTTPSTTGTRVVLVRLTPGVLSMKINVADQSQLPTFSVVEVADSEDRVRQSLTGYSVELR